MKARAFGLLAAVLLLPGCSTIEYYAQAIGGQMELVHRARPIAEALQDPQLPAPLRQRLSRVLAMREFASAELGLPDNASYRSYADLGRPYVLWNVFAAPEFSVRATESCFPIAGCVIYRGWFAQADAERHAASLRADGLDVYVGGVPAYSTLGWFNDPVLNTFIHYPEGEVARLLFHELAHQVAYVRDDTLFNESFAVTVEQEGVRRWLAREGSADERQKFEAFQSRRRDFIALILRHRARLEALYGMTLEPAQMRTRKAAAFGDLRADYEVLKRGWGGFAGYDRFFGDQLNNALLASVSAYTALVPAFEALLAESGGDLRRFYARVGELARMSKEERLARLPMPGPGK